MFGVPSPANYGNSCAIPTYARHSSTHAMPILCAPMTPTRCRLAATRRNIHASRRRRHYNNDIIIILYCVCVFAFFSGVLLLFSIALYPGVRCERERE